MKFLKLIIGFSVLFAGEIAADELASVSTSNQYADLNKGISRDYALLAMMASNAYLDAKRSYFPIELLGWKRVDRDGNLTDKNSFKGYISGLAFDIWEHESLPETVISFKGTKGVKDWLNNLSFIISPQYKKAKKEYIKYRDANLDRKITLTGHSLGGGLALSVSVWEGVEAIVFNSSPRFFDGKDDNNQPAVRKAIFQKGEILQKIRKRYPKFLEKIEPGDVIKAYFDFGKTNEHRMDYLAEGILRCAIENEDLKRIADKIEKKIECYL